MRILHVHLPISDIFLFELKKITCIAIEKTTARFYDFMIRYYTFHLRLCLLKIKLSKVDVRNIIYENKNKNKRNYDHDLCVFFYLLYIKYIC